MLADNPMWRRGQPQSGAIDPELAGLIAGLYDALEDNLERCARLTRAHHDGDSDPAQRQADALAGACRIAYVQRVTFEAITRLVDIRELPPGVLPISLLSALARLAYALAALAEPTPEPAALLTDDEIRHLPHQYAIEEWLERARAGNPDLHRGDP